jgi:hypothetical protein
VKKFNQARVNSGSNYDSLKVASRGDVTGVCILDVWSGTLILNNLYSVRLVGVLDGTDHGRKIYDGHDTDFRSGPLKIYE